MFRWLVNKQSDVATLEEAFRRERLFFVVSGQEAGTAPFYGHPLFSVFRPLD